MVYIAASCSYMLKTSKNTLFWDTLYSDLFCCIVRFFQRPILSLALSTNRPRTNNQCSQPHNLMNNHPLIMFGKLCNFRFRLKQITNQLLEYAFRSGYNYSGLWLQHVAFDGCERELRSGLHK